MFVNGIPTSLPLETLQQELTTFNPGHGMESPLRWRTSPGHWKGKLTSSVMIPLIGAKAVEISSRTDLYAVSTTFRTERKLRFGPYTPCANF